MMMKQFKDDAAIHFVKLGKEFADAANTLYKVCRGAGVGLLNKEGKNAGTGFS